MASTRQEAFIDRWSDIAVAASKISGVAPEVIMGQAALETGWGKSVAGNNMFGIKGRGQSVVTHEDIPGRGLVKSTESFRAYDDPVQSFDDHGRLMGKDRYSGVKGSVRDQIAAIGKSGYATDRNYASKLSSVVDVIQDHKTFQDAVVSGVAALDPAVPDFTGIAFNENRFDDNSFQINPVEAGLVEFGGTLPDPSAPYDFDPSSINLMGNQPIGPPGDFNWQGDQGFNSFNTDPLQAGFSLPGEAAPNFDDVDVGSFPDITANTAFDQRTNFTPSAPALPDIGDVDLGTFPSITEGLYAGPGPAEWSTDIAPAAPSFTDVSRAASGFSQGFNSDIPTPDFGAAPARTEADILGDMVANERAMGDVNQTAMTGWGSTLSGLSPQNAPLSIGSMGAGQFAPTGFTPQAPQPAPVAPQQQQPAPTPAPVKSAVSQQSFAPQSDMPVATAKNTSGFGDFSLSDLFGKSMPDDSFMNGMANPSIAKDYNPGILDGWTGNALKGAALGAITGGPLGALFGGLSGAANLSGRLGSALSNQFGGMFDATWDNWDPDTYGFGPGFNSRGERSHTGQDNSGNATMGDGSYSESSGRNENNPQGIL